MSDTGVGIDPDKQGIIFAPFRQTDGSITRRYGGTGLGLSISRRLVEMMGGRIWVESVPGEGSRFHFTIEFAKPVPAAAPAPAAVQGRNVRAIIVEQDEARRAHLSVMLQGWNIEAAVVNSGSTALDVIRWTARIGRPFAFALVGLSAALENGRFLLAALQREKGIAPLPLIVSGDQDSASFNSQDIDAVAWLNWPVSQSALLEAVFRFLPPSTVGGDISRSAPPGRQAGGKGLRILVAEDIAANQELILALFEKRNDLLTIVNNGREAVEAFQSGSFDLVLMDVQMPVMGGVEATAAIREMESPIGKHTPIVALTAHAIKGDRERYLASGMDGYVSKPIRAEELLREVDKWTSVTATSEA